jgi:pimeloyl-ACP methyl ester carboxylesterase
MDVEFVDVLWTGKNSVLERKAATAQVLVALMKAKETNPEGPVFAIGHSHGGSVLAYFLKEYPAAGSQLTGCAFLSTPFVAIKPRPRASSMMSGMFAVLALLYQIVVTAIYPPPSSSLNPVEVWLSYSWWQIAGLLGPIVPMLLFPVMLTIAESRVDQSVSNQTVNLPNGNYLFLRFAGDEAAAALSATQFFAWAAFKMAQSVRFLFYTNPISKAAPRLYGTVLILVIVSSFAAVLKTIDLSMQYGFATVLFKELQYYGSGFIVALLGACLIFLLFASTSVAALLVILWQAIAARAFGWTSLLSGFVIELAIEPLPLGDHKLFLIDWSSAAAGLEGIVHSWTYGHPLAIAHIQEWVVASLFKPDGSKPDSIINR